MKAKYIAEIGSNHNNNSARISELIKTAKELGFWAVKFQAFQPNELYWEGCEQQNAIANSRALNRYLIKGIKNCCDENKIKLIFTPFDSVYVGYLRPYVDNYKISSFDVLRKEMITLAYDNSPNTLFVSTGLATYNDLRDLFTYIVQEGIREDEEDTSTPLNICLMHCVSKYPTKKNESCLHMIRDLKEMFGLFANHFGYSDHTADVDVVKSAERFGAEYIELHFDLEDKKGAEFKYGHCWTPSMVKKLRKKTLRGYDWKRKLTDYFFSQSSYYSEVKKFGFAKQLTSFDLGQRADPSDGKRPMQELRVKN